MRIFLRNSYGWLYNAWGKRAYHRYYTHHDILKTRQRSETIFVFGAGSSLLEIPREDWARIQQHNNIGWNLFAFQDFVDVDFLIFRETHYQTLPERKAEIQEYVQRAHANPRMPNALWICQRGWFALASNLLIGSRPLPTDTPILRYRNTRRGQDQLPVEHFADGVTHGAGTLTDAVNIAYQGGWKRIVLIGIDLYDTSYYTPGKWEEDPKWQADNPDSVQQIHPTVQHGIVHQMGLWCTWLAERGVQLSVYNPRSLMTEVMPVFDWQALEN